MPAALLKQSKGLRFLTLRRCGRPLSEIASAAGQADACEYCGSLSRAVRRRPTAADCYRTPTAVGEQHTKKRKPFASFHIFLFSKRKMNGISSDTPPRLRCQSSPDGSVARRSMLQFVRTARAAASRSGGPLFAFAHRADHRRPRPEQLRRAAALSSAARTFGATPAAAEDKFYPHSVLGEQQNSKTCLAPPKKQKRPLTKRGRNQNIEAALARRGITSSCLRWSSWLPWERQSWSQPWEHLPWRSSSRLPRWHPPRRRSSWPRACANDGSWAWPPR